MKKILLAFVCFLCASQIYAIDYIAIDTVYRFTPGTGQNAGQSETYYPQNIFGLPWANADSLVPASMPEDMLSLGMGGEIVVGFKNHEITDGEGDDFYVYENVIYMQMVGGLFAEPAKVAVSSDGENWVEFPYDEMTLEGCAGVSPTLKAEDSTDIRKRGGDGFDLAKLGLSAIKYIKITDITEMLKNNKEHPYYNAVLSGFDLDAVVGVNFREAVSSVRENIVCINSLDEIARNYFGKVAVYDITGSRIFCGEASGLPELQLRSGVYFVKYGDQTVKFMK